MHTHPQSSETGGGATSCDPRNGELRELVYQARPMLRRVFQRFRVSPEDAEDLLQNVLIQFLRKRDEINQPDRWIVGAVRHECLGFLRKQRHQLHQAVDSALLELAPDPSAASAEHQSTRLALEQILKRVRPRCRQLLDARYLMGYTLAETAEKVGCRPSSVDQLVRRCVSALKELLGGPASLPGELATAPAPIGPS